MGLPSYAGRSESERRAWRRGVAQDCREVGLALIAIGLLYWVMMLAYALSLPHGWFSAVHVAGGDPLGAMKDPFRWVLWLGYWALAIGMWRRAKR
jgi:hypothetical protein